MNLFIDLCISSSVFRIENLKDYVSPNTLGKTSKDKNYSKYSNYFTYPSEIFPIEFPGICK